MQACTLDDSVISRVLTLVSEAKNDEDGPVVLHLGLSKPQPKHLEVDNLGLTSKDYKVLQEITGCKTRTGDALVAYALLPPLPIATRQLAKRHIRSAQLRSARAARSKVQINISRVIEALIVKGLESIDAKSAGRKIGNARKVA